MFKGSGFRGLGLSGFRVFWVSGRWGLGFTACSGFLEFRLLRLSRVERSKASRV